MPKPTVIFSVLAILFLFICIVHSVQNVPIDSSNKMKNAVFYLADITAQISKQFGGKVHLDAYKEVTNDEKLKDPANLVKGYVLKWVSLGHPILIKTRKSGKDLIFHEYRNGFYSFIEMLTPDQQMLLSKEAEKKYKRSIEPTQIDNLILSKFECEIELDKNKKLFGKVSTFTEFPLRIDFRAPKGSKERTLFKKELEDEDEIEVLCHVAIDGLTVQENSLTISSAKMQELQIYEEVFGPTHKSNDVVYVTREQLNQLAAKIHSSLHILETYQLAEKEFESTFVADLIQQVGAKTVFEPVTCNEALNNLSPFAMNLTSDLAADVVTKELSKVFSISTTGNKSRIVVNREALNSAKGSGKSELGGELTGNALMGLVKLKGALKVAVEASTESLSDKKDLDDQLNEMNSHKEDDVVWTREGNKILPKSIKVLELVRANFIKTLHFVRIKRFVKDSLFYKKFTLYVNTLNNISSRTDDSTSEMNSRFLVLETIMNRTSQIAIPKFETEITKINQVLTSQDRILRRLENLEPYMVKSNAQYRRYSALYEGQYCLLSMGDCPNTLKRHSMGLWWSMPGSGTPFKDKIGDSYVEISPPTNSKFNSTIQLHACCTY